MMEKFNNTFGFDPSKQPAAIPPDYKPDIDTTNLCNDSEKVQYWKFIGEMQWAVDLGRIDIMHDAVSLSRYLFALCKGHLSKIQDLYVYLKKYTSTSIKFNT